MWTDPIVEEIHQIRAEHAAQFNYNLAAIVRDLRKKELQSGKKFVSRPPRLLHDVSNNRRARGSNHKTARQRAVLSAMIS